uniref:Uncharacterized protein n=1 Tax=Arundo donax TaxID=35708 RepID=A0A0A9BCJ1_ARUDO
MQDNCPEACQCSFFLSDSRAH